jgi:hypothetical protein
VIPFRLPPTANSVAGSSVFGLPEFAMKIPHDASLQDSQMADPVTEEEVPTFGVRRHFLHFTGQYASTSVPAIPCIRGTFVLYDSQTTPSG